MSANVEFLLRLFDQDAAPRVSWEDFDGKRGDFLHACQLERFLSSDPSVHPAPSCPHCGEGVPYRIGDKHLCNRCHSGVDPRHLRCWGFDLSVFLGWLASRLGLRGGVRPVEERLWHLGVWGEKDGICECFYRRTGPLSEEGETRLAAYRNVLLLHGLSSPPDTERLRHRCVSLLEVLGDEGGPAVRGVRPLLRPRGSVRFLPHSGALWIGDATLGEVPAGSKEYFLLRRLAVDLDHFVSYADLKSDILRRSGSRDETEEATFCQGLKSRIKKKWIPQIDLVLATTNKADGYRLRGYAEL